MVNPKIILPSKVTVEIVDDSDDEAVIPHKRTRSLPLEKSRPVPASRTLVSPVIPVQNIKKERDEVISNRNEQVKESTARARYYYVPLSDMNRIAIRSVIMRNAADWPIHYQEYRFQIPLNDGPIAGKLRVIIMADEHDPSENQQTNQESNG